MEIINLQNVRKVFDNNEVIKNCNMSVKKGSIYGFLGRNGAGKTTVLKLIAGLLQPTSGTIKVFGMSMLTDRNKILKSCFQGNEMLLGCGAADRNKT